MPVHLPTPLPLSHIGFTRVEPGREYAELVECYWFINTKEHNPVNTCEHLHADGGHGIILNYESSLSFEGSKISSNSFFDGTNTISRTLGLQGALNAAGIRFKPAGAAILFDFPLKEIKNETISLDDANIPFHSVLYNRVKEALTREDKVSEIENWLSQVYNDNKCISKSILELIKAINHTKGIQPISLLEKHLGYSKRKIERLFNAQTGMSAKEYATNLRIEFARKLIKSNNSTSLTEIAYTLGYYDQAHFIKQFKKSTGLSPGEYRIKHINTENRRTDEDRLMNQLALSPPV